MAPFRPLPNSEKQWLTRWLEACTFRRMSRTAQAVSTVLHVLFILFLLIWSINPDVVPKPAEIIRIFAPRSLSTPSGGGGMRQPEPPRKGTLSRSAAKMFVTPLVQQARNVPKLVLPASLDLPPQIPSNTTGLPDGLGSLAAGGGGSSGIGTGKGDVAGDGSGHSYGNGEHDAVYSPGHGVSMPVPVKTVEPEYSEPGRKARISGSVLVYAEIDPAGHPRNLHVLRGMGMGLDEKAMQAVAQWLFRPGTKDGQPVSVRATFQVNFRLL